MYVNRIPTTIHRFPSSSYYCDPLVYQHIQEMQERVYYQEEQIRELQYQVRRIAQQLGYNYNYKR